MFSQQSITKIYPNPNLHTRTGERKYLNEEERTRFIDCACRQEFSVKMLCLVLVLSGCRLSEVLNLRKVDIQSAENAILIRSLKKRDKVIYRQIPLPHGIITGLIVLGQNEANKLFPWKRTQALMHIKRVMKSAEINGARATARGLRHTFGAHGIRCGVPLTLLQRWFGHASIETTAIYTQILGPEEREVASKMW